MQVVYDVALLRMPGPQQGKRGRREGGARVNRTIRASSMQQMPMYNSAVSLSAEAAT